LGSGHPDESIAFFCFFDAFSLAFLLSAFMPSLAIQICLAMPSLKNARQFVNGIFAHTTL